MNYKSIPKWWWKVASLGVLLACVFAFAEPNPSDLPEDAPATTEIVHHLRFPYAYSNEIDFGYTYLYGDKYLSSPGLSLSDSFFFSENWAINITAAYFFTSKNADYEEVLSHQLVPYAENPTYLVGLNLIYQPVYGKFALGSWIQRFKLGFKAGIHGAQETFASAPYPYQIGTSTLSVGPNLGLLLTFPVSDRFSANFNFDYFLHSAAESNRKQLWAGTFGMGMRF